MTNTHCADRGITLSNDYEFEDGKCAQCNELMTEEENIQFYNLLEKFIKSCDMPQMEIFKKANELKTLLDDGILEENEDTAMLERENHAMANALLKLGYTKDQLSDIVNGAI